MAHLLFLVMHLLALFLAAVLLFVTVPAHLIYVAVVRNRPARPTPATHVKCPACKELVLKEARVCKHCGERLIPQP